MLCIVIHILGYLCIYVVPEQDSHSYNVSSDALSKEVTDYDCPGKFSSIFSYIHTCICKYIFIVYGALDNHMLPSYIYNTTCMYNNYGIVSLCSAVTQMVQQNVIVQRYV